MANRKLHPVRTRRGFTLIELMIVVCIVGLLSTVALPEFQNIMLRSKQAERELMMNSIMRVLNEYTSSHGGKFPGGDEPDMPFNPVEEPNGKKQRFNMDLGHWKDLGWAPDGHLYYRYEVVLNGDGDLVITAKGDLNNNGLVSYKEIKFRLQGGMWQRMSETEYGDHF
ncbi:MAG TPA: prepilin-type N-terminal cleavage/methylation domain-containing protein [Archangium sp.]|uniref:type IV pilin protein n=1 Tax=Archangium sp. TaxID=1872627 RepID=UPI002E372521|nr:prepilin-type N-terminal cleavage/methylation domain-containing protein [Archangium sp.]HEX5751656.1 prepilin-type N-terminal cleavage/methylation domain-containing protein [Archangium sp.]